jgi:hypothetical protein
MSATLRALWAMPLLLAATGCGGFDRLDMVLRSAPADGATLTSDEIRLHEGVAVGFAARPMEDDNEQMDEETVVRLESGNPGIFQVAPSPRDEDLGDEAPYEFVIWGVAPGESSLGVFIDGDFETEIPVFIDEQ